MKNYKVIRTKRILPDQNLKEAQDFNGLMQKYEAKKSFKADIQFYLKAFLGVALVVSFMMFVNKNFVDNSGEENRIKPNEGTAILGEEDFIIEEPMNEKKSSDESGAQAKNETGTKTKEESIEIESSPKDNNKPNVSENIARQDSVQEYDYQEARPMDGMEALYLYFENNLKYPSESVQDSISGVTIVSFFIDKEGQPVEISIDKSLGENFDKAAIEVIENMPKWLPATINGNPIKSKMSVPLTFNIN
ncbi:energy transducer TonB [Fulvivirga sediminis]|uniref:Energy transducer TonB n=1 Tax=Fulvivirga sediminis TaxID=2803949 RepID=A0A937K269_9BACT|nr:energy transducer TonB [Fulvivirga sediminis]MBL3657477.1 energy transducer TonB [Fulvivirga sediminis]